MLEKSVVFYISNFKAFCQPLSLFLQLCFGMFTGGYVSGVKGADVLISLLIINVDCLLQNDVTVQSTHYSEDDPDYAVWVPPQGM